MIRTRKLKSLFGFGCAFIKDGETANTNIQAVGLLTSYKTT